MKRKTIVASLFGVVSADVWTCFRSRQGQRNDRQPDRRHIDREHWEREDRRAPN